MNIQLNKINLKWEVYEVQFSVLMSVYEKEKPDFLKSAIDSILNQSIKPDEIVIVKDGKLTKELDNIINSYAEQNPNLFNIVELLENKGLGTALAIGVEKCKNEIIARMDTDDICVYNRFEKQLEIFRNNPNIAMVGSCIDEFEGDMINKKKAAKKEYEKKKEKKKKKK